MAALARKARERSWATAKKENLSLLNAENGSHIFRSWSLVVAANRPGVQVYSVECVVCRRYDAILSCWRARAPHEVQVHSTWWDGAQALVTAVIYKNNTCLCRCRCRHRRRHRQPYLLSSTHRCFAAHCATCKHTWFVFSFAHFVFGPFQPARHHSVSGSQYKSSQLSVIITKCVWNIFQNGTQRHRKR